MERGKRRQEMSVNDGKKRQEAQKGGGNTCFKGVLKGSESASATSGPLEQKQS